MSLVDRIKKPLFVVNLEANEGRGEKEWKQIEYPIKNGKRNGKFDYGVRFTTKIRKETVDFIREDKKYGDIIAVGGDGTVNLVVEGIAPDFERTLAIIPTGTANDVSRTYNVYSDPDGFYNALLNGNRENRNIKEIDVGEVNGNYFLGYAGLGFDAVTLKERNKRRFLKGKLAYIAGALRTLFYYIPKEVEIKIDEKEVFDKDIFLMVISNIKHYAFGKKIAPNAKPDDGFLDLCMVGEKPSLGKILHNLLLLCPGEHRINLELNHHRIKKLEVISQEESVSLQLDGEEAGENNHFEFKLASNRLKMWVP